MTVYEDRKRRDEPRVAAHQFDQPNSVVRGFCLSVCCIDRASRFGDRGLKTKRLLDERDRMALSVIGVPKTIDNDRLQPSASISIVRTFPRFAPATLNEHVSVRTMMSPNKNSEILSTGSKTRFGIADKVASI